MDFDELEDSLMEDEEVMTAAEVLQKIESLWITEKMSPNLEPHHAELVDCMLDQLMQMNTNLNKCKKQDFRVAIHKMEIDRIRYIISSYLRTRLKKIEKYAKHLIEKDLQTGLDQDPLMSDEETNYAKRYVESINTHLSSLAAQHMPENLRNFSDKMVIKPNLDSYVFFKVAKPVHGLLIEDPSSEGRDEEVDLIVGEQHLMKYRTISDLLKKESIKLL